MASNWTALGPWGSLALLAVALVVATQLAHRLLRPVVLRMAGWSQVLLALVRRCDRSARLLEPLIALQLLWQGASEDLPGLATVQHFNGVLLIIAATLMCTSAIGGIADGVMASHPADSTDNLAARRIRTQTKVLSRIASGTVLVAGVAFVLMTFPRARQVGASLLASAGVAGVIVGIAARSVFSNLLAGLQIALAQPLRIDDVLIVEGEWGRVEEITATYVVLRIWDERRLIVPLGWLIEHPFQNWTRTTADLLGTVLLWADYSIPVDAVRAEAQRLCEASPNWDKRVCLVQVTDTSERAMQLRVLVSSSASGPNFDLRCEIREGLVAFINRVAPDSLPRARVELAGAEAIGVRPGAIASFKAP
jgi:small-conductance mechanosensitive channel